LLRIKFDPNFWTVKHQLDVKFELNVNFYPGGRERDDFRFESQLRVGRLLQRVHTSWTFLFQTDRKYSETFLNTRNIWCATKPLRNVSKCTSEKSLELLHIFVQIHNEMNSETFQKVSVFVSETILLITKVFKSVSLLQGLFYVTHSTVQF
jgi:hypothetical protein